VNLHRFLSYGVVAVVAWMVGYDFATGQNPNVPMTSESDSNPSSQVVSPVDLEPWVVVDVQPVSEQKLAAMPNRTTKMVMLPKWSNIW
jgi:hypothetical protein